MTSSLPVVKNNANGAILYTALAPRTANGTFQTNPTLASGDVKISLDGGAFANLNTLPVVTPSGGKAVKITLSQAETNADTIVILFSDAAGDEWSDQMIEIPTASQQFDDLASQSSLTAVKSKTDNLPSDPADASDVAAFFSTVNATLSTIAGYIDTEVSAIKAKTDNLPASPAATGDIPSAAAIRAEIDSNSTQLAAILADTAEIGAAGAGLTALGDARMANLDAAVTTRLASADYTAPDNAGIAAIQAKTDNLPDDPADQSLLIAATDALAADIAALPTANENADALLDRADGVESGRTLRQMLRGFAAVLLGKASGLDGTAAVYRDTGDTKARVTATVDADGNRSAVTLDLD